MHSVNFFKDLIIINKLIVEFIRQLELDHHGKPGNIGWTFRLNIGLWKIIE